MKKECPLCKNEARKFYEDTQRYYKCGVCHGIFVHPDDLPPENDEKERYLLHDSNTADEGYRRFVAPITKSIMQDFSPKNAGLDFGAGTSAIISVVLREAGYKIENYDPFFHNFVELLDKKYDYISSCEVIEHFYEPSKEFLRLRGMLREGAKLYLMTDIYDEAEDFATWYYKNDPTHVFFYSKDTFQWIASHYGFSHLSIDKRLIVLSN